jgi:hypothetical protein
MGPDPDCSPLAHENAGTGRSASIGRRLLLLALMQPAGAVGSVGAAVFDAAGAPARQPVAALAVG